MWGRETDMAELEASPRPSMALHTRPSRPSVTSSCCRTLCSVHASPLLSSLALSLYQGSLGYHKVPSIWTVLQGHPVRTEALCSTLPKGHQTFSAQPPSQFTWLGLMSVDCLLHCC